MDDKTLQSVIASELARAIGSAPGTTGSSEIAQERDDNLKRFFGEPFGNEITGRSQVVSRDPSDVVGWMLPQLVEIFLGGDTVCEAQPVGEEDIEAAEQATDYLKHIVLADNDGYRIFRDWFQDALIQKNGFIRVEPEKIETQKRMQFTGLDDAALAILQQDKGIEIVEYTEREGEAGTVHDVTVNRKTSEIRIKLAGVAPEDVAVAPRTIDLDETGFVAWRWRKTRSQLIEDGYDKDMVMDLPADQSAESSEERNTRFRDEQTLPNAAMMQKLREQVTGWTCYIRVDFDDDDRNELRRVTVGGQAHEIMDNDEIDEQPLVDLCPDPVPHKLFGRSVVEQITDIQQIKSTLMRQMLDNLYQINNNRTIVSERIDMSDMMTNRVGGVVQATGPEDVTGTYMPIVPTPIGDVILPALEYCDQVIETRTGQSRYNQGLDPDSLKSTATGVNMIMTASQKRLQMIARNFAEGGVKKAMRKVLRLVIAHQDAPRMIRLRNGFVPMDPRKWNAEMDVTVTVGLGHGSRDQQAAMLGYWGQFVEKVVMLQGGAVGPVLFWEDIYNYGDQLAQKVIGFKSSEPFITDPGPKEQQPPPQPQPDPEMVKAQAQMAIQQQKAQLDGQTKQQEHQLKMAELQAEIQRDREKWELERQKLLVELQVAREKAQIDVAKAGIDMQMKSQGQQQQIEFDREKHGMAMEQAKQKGENDDKKGGKSSGVSINLGGEGNDITKITGGLESAVKELSGLAKEFGKPKRVKKDKDGSWISGPA